MAVTGVAGDTDMAFFRTTVGAGVLVLTAMVVSTLPDPGFGEACFVTLMTAVGIVLMGVGGWGLASG